MLEIQKKNADKIKINAARLQQTTFSDRQIKEKLQFGQGGEGAKELQRNCWIRNLFSGPPASIMRQIHKERLIDRDGVWKTIKMTTKKQIDKYDK